MKNVVIIACLLFGAFLVAVLCGADQAFAGRVGISAVFFFTSLGNLCVFGTCYAFEYLFRDPSSSVRRALLWALVSRDSSPTTGAPVRMDLLVHSPLNAKSSNQISSSNGNRRPYRLKIDTGAGTVKRIAILSLAS